MNAGSFQIRIICRAVMLEFLRRKDLWVLALIMGAFALVAISARIIGIEDEESANFMLNLGLGLAGIFAHLLTVLIAGRQFPDDIENRTLYPMLAKPLSRKRLVVGKWFACTLCGTMIFLAFFLIAWFVSPHMQTYFGGTLVQHLLLQPVSLGVAAALAIAFSLLLPKGFALASSFALVFGAETIHQWAVEKTFLVHALPRVGAMDLSTRYTDGIAALMPQEWVSILVYGILWIATCLLLACGRFHRRAL